MSKQYGHVVEVDLHNDDITLAIPEATKIAVQTVLNAAKGQLGQRIKYDTLKVEYDYFPPGQYVRAYATVQTVESGYTLEEMKDLQVDMIRAIRGIDRNGGSL